MTSEFIYAAVNCSGHRPMLLAEHLHYAEASFRALYGAPPTLDCKTIAAKIERYLSEIRASRLGNTIHIYILPDGTLTIEHRAETIYRNYVHLAVKARAVLERYELAVEGHRTAVSLATADFMKRRAESLGANLTVRVNNAGEVVSSGDFPVAIVDNSVVITPECTPPCVEADLLDNLCSLSKINLRRERISVDRFLAADGAFIFNTSGIRSISHCNDTLYSHSMAAHLERKIEQAGIRHIG